MRLQQESWIKKEGGTEKVHEETMSDTFQIWPKTRIYRFKKWVNSKQNKSKEITKTHYSQKLKTMKKKKPLKTKREKQ